MCLCVTGERRNVLVMQKGKIGKCLYLGEEEREVPLCWWGRKGIFCVLEGKRREFLCVGREVRMPVYGRARGECVGLRGEYYRFPVCWKYEQIVSVRWIYVGE